ERRAGVLDAVLVDAAGGEEARVRLAVDIVRRDLELLDAQRARRRRRPRTEDQRGEVVVGLVGAVDDLAEQFVRSAGRAEGGDELLEPLAAEEAAVEAGLDQAVGVEARDVALAEDDRRLA